MSEPIVLTAATADRLDRVLAEGIETLSRSRLQALIESGHVRVNDAPCTQKKHKLKPGDRIAIAVPEAAPLDRLDPLAIDLDILYEDDDLLVVNKPVGLVVHPAPATPKTPSSTPSSTTAAIACPASAARSAPASSTASTKTPPARSSSPKPTWHTSTSKPRSPPKPPAANISASSTAPRARTAARCRVPSGGIPKTAKRWPSSRSIAAGVRR